MPYNNVTGDVDEAAISADGSTYTNPKYMTVIISSASGDKETDSPYDKPFPSCAFDQPRPPFPPSPLPS